MMCYCTFGKKLIELCDSVVNSTAIIDFQRKLSMYVERWL